MNFTSDFPREFGFYWFVAPGLQSAIPVFVRTGECEADVIKLLRRNNAALISIPVADFFWSDRSPQAIADEAANCLMANREAYIKVISHTINCGNSDPKVTAIEIWNNGECIYSAQDEEQGLIAGK